MEKNKMLQILLPAAAAAGVVVLIGVLIGTSDWGDSGQTQKGKDGKPAKVTGDDSGMSDAMPPADSPEWKPFPEGDMKVWDVKEGEGEPCRSGAVVTIHYTGWTLDGKVFDSSRKRGEPATFPLGDLIKGWQKGIPGMKPGGIRRLMIPYQWAYGERGNPPTIPPKATLVFEVKYLGSS